MDKTHHPVGESAAGPVHGAIDAGGTTFKCLLATGSGAALAETRVPTTSPAETLAACAAFFNDAQAVHGTMAALGVAAFGPIDVDPASPDFGRIGKTPKAGWSGTNLRAWLGEALGVPVALDTDVNAALLAEMAWGAARGASSAAYVTIGTGIGAGVFANGGLIGKPRHPEFGHIRVARHPEDHAFSGVCALHGDCLEGLASAVALTARFGDPRALGPEHPAWAIEGRYLGQACLALSLAFRPQKIVLGGGLMLADALLDATRASYGALMAGYLEETAADIDALIVRPGLGDEAGMRGGLALALALTLDPGQDA